MGVLVAISIPIFTSQLEKSREAVDTANIRAAYAEVMSSELTGEASDGVTASGTHFTKTVDLKQQTTGWQTEPGKPKNLTEATDATDPVKDGKATITSTDTGATISIKMTKKATA